MLPSASRPLKTRGPLTLSITAFGEIPPAQALRRDGAKTGDLIWVSGRPGLASLGLASLQGKITLPAPWDRLCVGALEKPRPRVALGAGVGNERFSADLNQRILIFMKTYLASLGRVATIALCLGTNWAISADQLTVVTVGPHAVDRGFPAESVVEAVYQSSVGAQVPGRILEVRADAGQRVKKGELLMRIDAREANEAARAADAQYGVAKLNYERHQQLKAQKFVSQAALWKACVNH